ncbi:hypothetical protein [Desulfosarcina ovata]|uniref:hypothetical protein n=1 Tax=Desulfosarcina ovata TaxID=83564 RepID=UPI0012D35D81|nr:hypothetical protein [Desulfosarcina ovata]
MKIKKIYPGRRKRKEKKTGEKQRTRKVKKQEGKNTPESLNFETMNQLIKNQIHNTLLAGLDGRQPVTIHRNPLFSVNLSGAPLPETKGRRAIPRPHQKGHLRRDHGFSQFPSTNLGGARLDTPCKLRLGQPNMMPDFQKLISRQIEPPRPPARLFNIQIPRQVKRSFPGIISHQPIRENPPKSSHRAGGGLSRNAESFGQQGRIPMMASAKLRLDPLNTLRHPPHILSHRSILDHSVTHLDFHNHVIPNVAKQGFHLTIHKALGIQIARKRRFKALIQTSVKCRKILSSRRLPSNGPQNFNPFFRQTKRRFDVSQITDIPPQLQ